jgi:hypothetical protein
LKDSVEESHPIRVRLFRFGRVWEVEVGNLLRRAEVGSDWGMRVILFSVLISSSAIAESCRVLVEGAGCRTRQLAIQRIWMALEGVDEVRILPREEAPAANHRYFILRSGGESPDKEELIRALGRRAKHYKVVSVEPEARGSDD